MVFVKGCVMGKSTVLARLVAVCAVTAVAGGVLTGAPVSAQAPDAPSSSVATPGTSVALRAPVGGDGVTPRAARAVTPRAARATGLRIKIAGVTAGGRASVKVTGPKQSTRKKAKKYSKAIHRSTTLRVVPGKYKITSRRVAATGGTDVPGVATKKLRVRNNKLTRFTVHYRFVAASCAGGGPCVVGDTGPGGGKVFYVDPTRPVGSRNFEAAPDGWNGATPAADPTAAWCSGTPQLLAGSFGITIGTGKANTALMVAAVLPGPCTSGVGYMAYNYVNGTANSWFLPSKDELNQLCKWARGQSTTVANQAVQCDPSGTLQPGFAGNYYWSSSQDDAIGAWALLFFFGNPSPIAKTEIRSVRPVRAF